MWKNFVNIQIKEKNKFQSGIDIWEEIRITSAVVYPILK